MVAPKMQQKTRVLPKVSRVIPNTQHVGINLMSPVLVATVQSKKAASLIPSTYAVHHKRLPIVGLDSVKARQAQMKTFQIIPHCMNPVSGVEAPVQIFHTTERVARTRPQVPVDIDTRVSLNRALL